MDTNEILKGVEECISEEELKERLSLNRPLRVKYGIDASGPDIHLGFTVGLRKLRQLQDLGHIAVIIVGDFTAMIGDPTGRSKTRPQLTREDVEQNMKRYERQVFRILRKDRVEIHYNSKWLDALRARDIINLTSMYTVARMLERDDFEKRYKNEIPIHLHEFLYPIFQGYDSVMVKADIEIGGTDQKFNFMVARQLQRNFKQKPQIILFMPLLEGLDGVRKMSKSYGNYIAIEDKPSQMFGKAMSIPDNLILRYFNLTIDSTEDELKNIEKRLKSDENPRDIKLEYATRLVKQYYSQDIALQERDRFISIFSRKELPEDVEVYNINEEINIVDLLVSSGLVKSKSEARRLIMQKAVSFNKERIENSDKYFSKKDRGILKVGKKRFLKLNS